MNLVNSQPVIKELAAATAPAWDAFVHEAPAATFFHLAGWKRVIEDSFGHRAYFLYAEQAGQIRGVLPLVHVKSRLFGNTLVSLPFAVYGGPVATDETVRLALDAHALALADRLDVDHLEYRCQVRQHPDWACKDSLYATFRRAIDPDPEKNLLAIPRKQRAVVRQSLKAGLESRIDDDVELIYDLYAESVRNLGTPVFARRYFRNLKREFGAACEILNVFGEGKPVAGVLTFYFRDQVMPYYAGGTPDARRFGAHDFMYYDLITRAAQNGYRQFDFGRSKQGTGAFSFKKNWGFKPEFLPYEYYLRRGAEVRENNPLNPKYRLFIETWKRLPLPIANLIGPHIVRNLG